MGLQYIDGIYHGTKNGYGYISIEDRGEVRDIQINISSGSEAAFEGDYVRIAVQVNESENNGNEKAKVTKILKKAQTDITGILKISGNKKYILPLEYIPFKVPVKEGIVLNGEYRDGDIILARLNNYRTADMIKVVPVLNFYSSEELDSFARSMIYNTKILTDFPLDVIDEARNTMYDKIESKQPSRKDLRSKEIFTVSDDVFSSKDFAFSMQETENGYVFGIHTADAAEYVVPGTAMYREAMLRGKTCYREYGCSPMLPVELVDYACNLNDKESKLAVSVFIEFDKNGNNIGCEICESVIRVKTAATYSEIDAVILEQDTSAVLALNEKYTGIKEQILNIYRIAAILKGKRMKNNGFFVEEVRTVYRGYSNNEINESEIQFEPDFSMAVKELVIIAGKAVAEKLSLENSPAIYSFIKEKTYQNYMDIPEYLNLLPGENNLSKKGYTKTAVEYGIKNNFETATYKLLGAMIEYPEFGDTPEHDDLYDAEKFIRFLCPVHSFSQLIAQRSLKAFLKNENIDLRDEIKAANEIERNISKIEKKLKILFDIESVKKNTDKTYKAKIIKKKKEYLFVMTDNGIFGVVENTRGQLAEFNEGEGITVKTDRWSFYEKRVYFKTAT